MKVAIVTGGGRGLGRAFAQALAAAGYAVAVMARTTAELAETVALITRSGGKASAFPADVADAVAVDRAFTDIERSLGPIDLLVNNASVVGPLGPFTQSDVGAWWCTLEVNLQGQILCAHRALPGMIARRGGRTPGRPRVGQGGCPVGTLRLPRGRSRSADRGSSGNRDQEALFPAGPAALSGLHAGRTAGRAGVNCARSQAQISPRAC